MRFTVFTPTYNRAYMIEKLYHSLRMQTFCDFEWIVIDDGSTDNTKELFASFMIERNNFPIRYVKVENGGKHRAINRGVKMAQGELFYIVDSDDYLPNDALEIIDRIESTIIIKEVFAGVCGRKEFPAGRDWGTSFKGNWIDITTLERERYQITGDKAEVFYTEILKKYPFPEFDGENFLTEAVVWDRIAADGYKLRHFNQTVMYCDYFSDGLSAKGNALFYSNPKGYALYLRQCGMYRANKWQDKWNMYLNYYRIVQEKQSFDETARDLQLHPVQLRVGLLAIRLLNRLSR